MCLQHAEKLVADQEAASGSSPIESYFLSEIFFARDLTSSMEQQLVSLISTSAKFGAFENEKQDTLRQIMGDEVCDVFVETDSQRL